MSGFASSTNWWHQGAKVRSLRSARRVAKAGWQKLTRRWYLSRRGVHLRNRSASMRWRNATFVNRKRGGSR